MCQHSQLTTPNSFIIQKLILLHRRSISAKIGLSLRKDNPVI